MKNWKTTAFGIASVVAFIVGQFWPEYKTFCDGLVAALVAAGFLTAKDFDRTGV